MIDRTIFEAVTQVLSDLGTPRALMVEKLLRNSEWDQIALLQLDPREYIDAELFKRDAIAFGLLKKFKDLPTTINRRHKAVQSFFISEHECYRTNHRLAAYLPSNALTGAAEDTVSQIICDIRKDLRMMIGTAPPMSTLIGRFGPGATFSDKGHLTTVSDKMTSSPTCTNSSILFESGFSAHTEWGRLLSRKRGGAAVTYVRGNRFTTVPKDASKDRGICIEPSINVFYQLGVGTELRRRLRHHGVDLLNAQQLHRAKAREASITGEFATFDLSNASDTICSNLIKVLLPESWCSLMESLRSPYTLIEGKWVRLEKFSSMGNGFTFELETLIFLAIARSALRLCSLTPINWKNVFVYGDDIIIPTECSKVLTYLLTFFGFRTNGNKTFSTGFFRESCGGDYFNGQDVRPVHIRETPNGPADVIVLANLIKRLKPSVGFDYSLKGWRRVLNSLPSSVRKCRGPAALGDIVIHDDFPFWQYRVRCSIGYVRCLVPYVKRYVGWAHFSPDVVLATALYGTGDGERGITPRNPDLGYRFGWVPYS